MFAAAAAAVPSESISMSGALNPMLTVIIAVIGPFGPGTGFSFSVGRISSAAAPKPWENKDRGPKGPIKERYSGRMGGLYDDPNDEVIGPPKDFDDPAAKAPDEGDDK